MLRFRMPPKRTFLWVGVGIYALSFSLVAGAERWPGRELMRGYWAAVVSVWVPLVYNPFRSAWLFDSRKFAYVALLISGWINPLFLVTLALALLRRHRLTVSVLRIILLLMFPFCWVEFAFSNFYPREGYFLWLLGMLLVLFSFEFRTRAGGNVSCVNRRFDSGER